MKSPPETREMTDHEYSDRSNRAGRPLRILIDICHPAHAHFFALPIQHLKREGNEVLITSRQKEMTTSLLSRMNLEHECISNQRTGLLGLSAELLLRDLRLISRVRRFKPDVLCAIGGTFVAHAGFVTGRPAVVFYDTENARLQNLITYPLVKKLVVPECYGGWVPRRGVERYPGYHELSYLHPSHWQPCRKTAIANGLSDNGDTFFMRLVSWKANHDIGEKRLTSDSVRHVVRALSEKGKVIISCEGEMPEDLLSFRYEGNPLEVHHVLAFCRGYFGESATMASECAVMGVPAVYAAHTGRGYTDHQEARFGLVKNEHTLEHAEICQSIEWLLNRQQQENQRARDQLLSETIDVSTFVAAKITEMAVRRQAQG